jgi:hypothetical protein
MYTRGTLSSTSLREERVPEALRRRRQGGSPLTMGA